MSIAKNLKRGDIFYEHVYGLRITCKVLTDVEETVDEHRKWSWVAENIETGEPINFLVTEGLEHYGPDLSLPNNVLSHRLLK